MKISLLKYLPLLLRIVIFDGNNSIYIFVHRVARKCVTVHFAFKIAKLNKAIVDARNTLRHSQIVYMLFALSQSNVIRARRPACRSLSSKPPTSRRKFPKVEFARRIRRIDSVVAFVFVSEFARIAERNDESPRREIDLSFM